VKKLLNVSLSPGHYLPLWEGVYQVVREAIVEGDLVPGQRLAEQQLAEELGVSRTPVREALRRLALEGFVVMVPRRGAYVAGMSLKDMNDVFELRMALEGLGAYLAAQRITPQEQTALREVLGQLEAATIADDKEQVISMDTRFHTLIYTASRNRRLIQIVGNLADQIQGFRLESLFAPGRLKDTMKEHRRLIAAIERRDANKARRLAEEHVRQAEASLLKNRDKATCTGERSNTGGGCVDSGGGAEHQKTSGGESGII
jgi:DNA-binding GntR family transcriptional regulator